MRNIAKIAAIGGVGVAAVLGAKKVKQSRASRNGNGSSPVPAEGLDIADDSDPLFQPNNESV